jgi:hypothetical protein
MEVPMNIRFRLLAALIATISLVTFAAGSVFAATSPAMQACSKQWSDMKKANKVPEGEKWSEFWSQCSKDYAAKNGGDTGAEAATEKTTKPKKTAAVSEDDSATSVQQKKDCDAKWDANKAKTGAHGWHDYFQFMARCM